MMFEVKLCFSKCFASTPAPYVREWERITGTFTGKPEGGRGQGQIFERGLGVKRFFHARKEGGGGETFLPGKMGGG